MFEKALVGSQRYWKWVGFLAVIAGLGVATYLYQLTEGLKITGMSRDVSWGFYIAQFTFLVGVAASAVMLVLPYYLHHVKEFSKITILGEFLAVAAVSMCVLFITVDLGRPDRILNVLLYPTPNSVLFWDMVVLNGYLFLNIVIGWTVLSAEKKGLPAPGWTKTLIYISIPWAVSIHTVTAFLYAGLPGRHYWLTAILAVRFLGSAFAAGPALLILLALIIKKYTAFDAGKAALEKIARIVTYAMIASVFFVILEVFTAFYSSIPGHMHPIVFMFTGLEGHWYLAPFMWTSAILAVAAIAILINPKTRGNEKTLAIGCACVFFSLWIEKGLGLIIAGFTPNAFDEVTTYFPTAPELMISLGVWAIGFLILTVLYKIAVSVREQENA